MKILLYFLLSLVILSSGCAFAPPKLNIPEQFTSMNELEPYLNRAVDQQAPPGLTLAVVKGNETPYLKSFGMADGPRSIAATGKTPYQWWSLTKLFTVTAILQLMEQGKLDLDEPAVTYLPFLYFRGNIKHNSDITIRHLLSHSSGLNDIGIGILGWVHYEGDPALNQTQLLKSKLGKYNKVKVEPGHEGRYTNFGYLMLAAVIEAVSGQSYENYVKTHILTPLGMDHTNFIYTTAMSEYEASGTHPRDFISYLVPMFIDMNRTVRERENGIYWFNRVYSDQKGSTGLIGSTEDLIKFVKALLNEGQYKNVRILSPSSVVLMQQPIIEVTKSPAPTSDDMEFGLGWFIHREGDKVTLSHGGSGMGFVAMLQILLPQKVAVIAIANSTYLGRTMGYDLVKQVGDLEW